MQNAIHSVWWMGKFSMLLLYLFFVIELDRYMKSKNFSNLCLWKIANINTDTLHCSCMRLNICLTYTALYILINPVLVFAAIKLFKWQGRRWNLWIWIRCVWSSNGKATATKVNGDASNESPTLTSASATTQLPNVSQTLILIIIVLRLEQLFSFDTHTCTCNCVIIRNI